MSECVCKKKRRKRKRKCTSDHNEKMSEAEIILESGVSGQEMDRLQEDLAVVC